MKPRNLITGNIFRRSSYEHILLNETAPFAAISGNQISNNQFFSVNEVPVYRLWSHHGSTHLLRFAEFSRNRYVANQQRFAELEGKGWVTASDWMARINDTASIVSPSGTFPQLTRQRQQKKRVGH